MQRISVHLTDETIQRIELALKANRETSESALIRKAIDTGLDIIAPNFNSAKALLNLVKLAEKLPSKKGEPTDVSTNHDYYAWGGSKKK